MPRHRRILGTQAQIILKRCQNIYAAQRRRAKKYGQTLNYTCAELWALVKDLPICPYCGEAVSARDFSFDHMTAASQGGSFKLSNLTPCHDPCNRAKGIWDCESWKMLVEWLEKNVRPELVKDLKMRLKAGSAWIHSSWGR